MSVPTAAAAQAAWTYDDALAWLYGRQALGIKLGLDNMHELLAAVGDPQHAFATVQVAGTNGKGTVTRLLAATLTAAGHRTGAYTSPHLSQFTERIRIDGQPIGRADVAHHLATLRPHVAAMDAARRHSTFFEVATALALLHFRAASVTWAVLETGMGGRLDATNVVAPEACIITNIGRDHMAQLGDSPQAIAAEKAGIMKTGVPCVTAATEPALAVLKAFSRGLRVPMSILGEDYHAWPQPGGFRLANPHGEADYHLRVVCRDKEAYNEFLEGFMFRLPGIAHVRTNLILKDIKLHGRLPV